MCGCPECERNKRESLRIALAARIVKKCEMCGRNFRDCQQDANLCWRCENVGPQAHADVNLGEAGE